MYSKKKAELPKKPGVVAIIWYGSIILLWCILKIILQEMNFCMQPLHRRTGVYTFSLSDKLGTNYKFLV